MEERAGEPPSALDRGERDPERLGDLLVREAPEEPQLDQGGALGIELGESGECRVECQDLGRPFVGEPKPIVEIGVEGDGRGSAAPLVPVPTPCVVDEDPPHHARRDPVEVTPVPPLPHLLVEQLEEGLVDEARRLEGVVPSLAAQIRPCQLAELAIEDGHHLVSSPIVALPPAAQQPGDGLLGSVGRGVGHGGFLDDPEANPAGHVTD